MNLAMGCHLEEFKTYRKALEVPFSREEKVPVTGERVIEQDPARLIVFREGDKIP
ncbi:MAG: hypothetical protein ACE5QF_02385 [Thermoplasmata archaeon]